MNTTPALELEVMPAELATVGVDGKFYQLGEMPAEGYAQLLAAVGELLKAIRREWLALQGGAK